MRVGKGGKVRGGDEEREVTITQGICDEEVIQSLAIYTITIP